jgi:hypothetical protein
VLTEDWSAVNAAVRRRAGLPDRAPPPPDPDAVVRAEARRRRLIGVAVLMVAFGVTVLLCACTWEYTPPVTATGLMLPPLRIHLDDLAKLAEARAPASPAAPAASGDPAAVTNYVVFHNVGFAHGVVVTGWRYASNADPAPAAEYCYFEARPASGAAQVAFLENADRKRLPYPGGDGALGLGRAEWDDASTKCRWHRRPR